MIISHIKLRNWRNFREVDVDLRERIFLAGPNASGKSNFLDVFKFLRDIAKKQGGGLQRAVKDRGGLSKIRCLSTRQSPEVVIEVHLAEGVGQKFKWKYEIALKQEVRGKLIGGQRQPFLAYERVWKNDNLILSRPDADDKNDPLRLTQTHLEQINANRPFRDIANYFESILYLHLIPQMLRHPEMFSRTKVYDDPYGRNFLDHIAETPEKTTKARLKKIEKALRVAVPQLKQLTQTKDERGIPHLEAVYEHWRPNAGKQREDQFSDGTLRLIGLLWSLLESDSLLLLEEPELSLNAAIISKLPGLMHRLMKAKKGSRKSQIIMSTHSADLLSDAGIGGEEVLLLMPKSEGTEIFQASTFKDINVLLKSGLSVSEVVMPRTKPLNIDQLSLFK